MSTPVTVGIDIGTSSVKAVAADDDGIVVASARVPHTFRVPTPGGFEHDAADAWRRGPRQALRELGALDVRGVSVAAMVPSLTAVDHDGIPVQPGLLYGDERGRTATRGNPVETGELLTFLRWLVAAQPDAAGYWPAQAVANHELSGEAILDTSTAATAYPLFDWQTWDPAVAADVGARPDQFPRLVPTGWEAQRVDGDGPPLASGCIDALAEQLVAGADDDGDVLVLLGTTLIVWAVTNETTEAPGLYLLPHTAPGKMLVGGPSNAGGLFCNWASGMLGAPRGPVDPRRVPVWVPYPRGERSPIDDPDRRAQLLDLDLTHDAAAVRRAAFEASGFVTRRILDIAREHHGITPRRLVASGGGTRVDDWVQAVADATNLPVDCVAVPEGGALGSAWLARIAAGLEEPTAMTEGRRWARVGRRLEPDRAWVEATAARYERFRDAAA
ncbi:MAG TPA: FGGY-family carbohydrate kinase [Acidimicrobiia bacterium]|nr:FGGY-family carbohydrate kinase [Acidimicrobiia bacterium]